MNIVFKMVSIKYMRNGDQDLGFATNIYIAIRQSLQSHGLVAYYKAVIIS